mmetsp:Transcript_6532/g.9849  ORF Transcript_6532/g.9849 Transcript_6532/m.9849 type:complete len:214 (+) Transcript_6532:898-1539(+)
MTISWRSTFPLRTALRRRLSKSFPRPTQYVGSLLRSRTARRRSTSTPTFPWPASLALCPVCLVSRHKASRTLSLRLAPNLAARSRPSRSASQSKELTGSTSSSTTTSMDSSSTLPLKTLLKATLAFTTRTATALLTQSFRPGTKDTTLFTLRRCQCLRARISSRFLPRASTRPPLDTTTLATFTTFLQIRALRQRHLFQTTFAHLQAKPQPRP